jgi:preprotein translocase subunit SecD
MLRSLLIAATIPFLAVSSAGAAGVKLVYEIDKQDVARDPHMARHAMTLINNRLALQGIKDADVNVVGEDRVSVSFPDDNPKLIDRAKRSVSRPGHLEFRIVADTAVPQHAKTIELAKSQRGDKSANEVRDTDKRLAAKWVSIAPSASAPPQKSLVSRHDNEAGDELLVLIDDFNVTGDYVKGALSSFGDDGWCVLFNLNEKGAKLFGDFTAANLPDPAMGTGRELAIIIDDELFTAAKIRSRITDSGQITGKFTEAESLGLAGILNEEAILKSVPPLPKLKLVSESKSE